MPMVNASDALPQQQPSKPRKIARIWPLRTKPVAKVSSGRLASQRAVSASNSYMPARADIVIDIRFGCYCGRTFKSAHGLRVHQAKSAHYCRQCLALLTAADELAGECTQCHKRL